MIRDVNEKNLISSLGWVEKGSLWIFDIENESVEAVKISEASYLSLNQGKQNLFSVEHHFEDNHLEITAHSASKPAEVLSKIVVYDEKYSFSGNPIVWNELPKSYAPYMTHNGVKNYWLLTIDAVNQNITFQQFEWFDDSYDKGYQGIIGVTEIPDSDLLLISIQRNSHPVLYDPIKRNLIRKIDLAGGYGNPKLRFLTTANELWADDYDTILKLDQTEWSVKASKKLQDADEGMSQFIGEYNFNNDESLCIVARPFSGDVIALDTKSLKIRYQCKIGNQPLEAIMLNDQKVFARDWQTGSLLSGRMKRRFFG